MNGRGGHFGGQDKERNMLKTILFAGLFAAAVTPTPGAVTYASGQAALDHATSQIREAKTKPLRICYDSKTSKQADHILIDSRATDGRRVAYEVRKLSAGGWRVAMIESPDEWPHAVTCDKV